MFELHQGALEIPSIYARWYEYAKDKNCGALITFCGIVRAEDEIEALSFDIYEPLLKTWFEKWCQKLTNENVSLMFAHSIGEVKVYESSYFAGVLSKQRKLGLKLINDFVEDFKASAPIWKYDIINGKKIYAKERSLKLQGAGILSTKD
ncbi:molybdenum cofactor biosynthesis protein MoaE [Campylobacter sp. IFREMER_LSEM_CL1846]|uniref:molybdopterin synthase catalytic subunit n=1 Tax=Campylobacter sp. IFREMER_LSEM_CL1846 TaxID=2911614 RepID=UPI0021E682AC|nr:molybdenum cofactor biosynthesis protein MoaE [Campylobacter sp. IFREMER_LSEM_CL1846]HEC1747973.1 molybdenum cofactor biosynthesis protein MoaE [Campylobacter lari]MCV3434061.1 molybdenum cofactor biosynthesis protein MoaE [Campylobacter sp. IFREMER_LSEM_CL1846]HEC1768008.1 molybdenum cofactor biosynthesis protein MoaE [Campylobacter lari]HEC1788540.1 molybdenum cofactor biosynthesis protein MoaE [Campylobacter lari]HEC1795696.1 molybdenum cofactor biosynthesis protein MoaE [Campylobacter l